jgi:DNA polymerase-1
MTDLLIDADIFLFRAAQGAEVEIDWGDGIWTLHSEPERALMKFREAVAQVRSQLGEEGETVLCFSDPARRCFRHDLSDTYKANRKDTRKPLAYHPMREQLMTEVKSIIKPGLEADDVMGIVSTRAPGRYVIVSADKDLKTIPGTLYRGGELSKINEAEADFWHLYQTLIGDVTDGYPGCPGIGPKTAPAILGVKEGDLFPTVADMWPRVVKAFEKAKQTPDNAILQARLARILRASDWDFKKSEVKLWQPPSA